MVGERPRQGEAAVEVCHKKRHGGNAAHQQLQHRAPELHVRDRNGGVEDESAAKQLISQAQQIEAYAQNQGGPHGAFAGCELLPGGFGGLPVVLPLCLHPAGANLMRICRRVADRQGAEGVQDPGSLFLLRPGQQLRGLNAAARIAQIGLNPQALRKNPVFQIPPVTVGAAGIVLTGPGGKQHDTAYQDHPDGLCLVVQQKRKGQQGAGHSQQPKHASIPPGILPAEFSRRAADCLHLFQSGIRLMSGGETGIPLL